MHFWNIFVFYNIKMSQIALRDGFVANSASDWIYVRKTIVNDCDDDPFELTNSLCKWLHVNRKLFAGGEKFPENIPKPISQFILEITFDFFCLEMKIAFIWLLVDSKRKIAMVFIQLRIYSYLLSNLKEISKQVLLSKVVFASFLWLLTVFLFFFILLSFFLLSCCLFSNSWEWCCWSICS